MTPACRVARSGAVLVGVAFLVAHHGLARHGICPGDKQTLS